MTQDYFLLSEVADLLQVRAHVLSYAITSGKLPEPRLVLGNKRVFSKDDVEMAREYFESKLEEKNKMNDRDYVSMRSLGAEIGVTSHVIGRALKDLNLRDENGKPTRAAFEAKLVDQLPSTQPGTFFYGWHRVKTLEKLSQAGLVRAQGI